MRPSLVNVQPDISPTDHFTTIAQALQPPPPLDFLINPMYHMLSGSSTVPFQGAEVQQKPAS
jgi:hypothetical protein